MPTKGGTVAKNGYYINLKQLKPVIIKVSDSILPGTAEDSYWRINLPLLIIFAVLIGGSYALFLPAIGFLVAAWFILAVAGIFICQKIACKLMRRICAVEGWLCQFIQKHICQTCTGKKTCDNNTPMLARAIVLALIITVALAFGIWLGRIS